MPYFFQTESNYMKMIIKIPGVLFLAVLFLSKSLSGQEMNDSSLIDGRAKFEPENGQCLFFVGQDMHAIGGLPNYNDGYCDHFDMPAGITLYTNFSPGTNSYGHINKGNDGIRQTTNWGAGDSCVQCYTDDARFEYSLLSIGLSFVDNEKQLAAGVHDALIKSLGTWIKSLGKRPVFIRLGYEFDGWDWNHYNRKDYLASWKRIHSIFKEMGVVNVAWVWQSKGWGSDQKILEKWYPGDEWVDWCGYSYFNNPDEEMLVFARRHKKPVFIAEATPVLGDGGLYFNTDLKDPRVAKIAWQKWFTTFLDTLNKNRDVIKALSYINADWPSEPMWSQNPVFQKVDARIQESPYVSKLWNDEFTKPRYLKPTPELWELLWKE